MGQKLFSGMPSYAAGIELAFEPGDPTTLQELLRKTASRKKESGIIYLRSDNTEIFQSYRDLLHQALTILHVLNGHGVGRGDKLILEINSNRLFYPVFWACIFGGIIPAPVSEPLSFTGESAELKKILRIWEILRRPIIVTIEKNRNKYEEAFAGKAEILCAENLSGDTEGVVAPVGRNDTAFLQFSSGSTGDPKGVILAHGNIIANLKSIETALAFTENDVFCNWLPHTHDMGIIGSHLAILNRNMLQIQMEPQLFFRNPLPYCSLIKKYRASITAMPNFGYDWLVERIKPDMLPEIDFSSMRVMTNGAEPVSVGTLRKFHDRFRAHGLAESAVLPVYGLAEATLAVSFTPIGESPVVLRIDRNAFTIDRKLVEIADDGKDYFEIACVGKPLPGLEIKITDDDDSIVPDGTIGNILIKGPNVTKGYVNLTPEENAEYFLDGWLRTGDMGCMYEGGLYITGRKKDVIFIRGRNFYANDIEEIIYETGIQRRGYAAAVGRTNPETETDEIVIFLRSKSSVEDFVATVDRVKKHLFSRIGFVDTVFIPVREIPKTTSGKIKRYLLKMEFESGTYDEIRRRIDRTISSREENDLPITAPEGAVEMKIRSAWSDVLGIREDRIGAEADFFELGGTSVKAMQLLARLEGIAGHELGHEILIECRTIRRMGIFLQRNQEGTARQTLPGRIDRLKSRDGLGRRATDVYRDIAVTGIALRFPGAEDAETFWNNLASGRTPDSVVPKDRLELAGVDSWPGYLKTIDGIDSFDSSFFGISENDARFMDPQQRLTLEICYHALEDSGLAYRLSEGLNAGVYIGASYNGYMELVKDFIAGHGVGGIPANTMAGNLLNMIAANISQAFNFSGPSMSVDTACSSSLTALYYAVNDLRTRACEYAVVGGVNLVPTPTVAGLSEKAGICSRVPFCAPFDSEADGTLIGEGVGIVVLEPLVSAVKSGRKLYGIIRGIGIGNDGRSLGIMAPNPAGQIRALSAAYEDAITDPSDVTYIEAHGTGTHIGDNVELNALTRIFKEFGKAPRSCGIGSVKSNIGHLLAAAGMAGLIKTLLCLKHRRLVPTLNIEKPNKYLADENNPLYPTLSSADWTPGVERKARLAGVSSFGFGGTNVHVVIEEPPLISPNGSNEKLHHPIAISAKDEDGLMENFIAWKKFCRSEKARVNVHDVCATNNLCKQHLAQRRIFSVASLEELSDAIDESIERLKTGRKEPEKRRKPKVIFVFTAYDEAIVSECMKLRAVSANYRKEISGLIERLGENAGDECFTGQSPYLTYFVFVLAYARFLLSSGIKPNKVYGFGLGELAAASFNGAIDPAAALKIIDAYSTGNGRVRIERIMSNVETHESAYEMPAPSMEAFFGYERMLAYFTKRSETKPEETVEPAGGDFVLRIGDSDGSAFGVHEADHDRTSGKIGPWETYARRVTSLYEKGVAIDWVYFESEYSHSRVDIPGYAFSRKRLWVR